VVYSIKVVGCQQSATGRTWLSRCACVPSLSVAVQLAVSIADVNGQFGANGLMLTCVLAAIFFVMSAFFVWRSFYGMRIGAGELEAVGAMGTDRESVAAD